MFKTLHQHLPNPRAAEQGAVHPVHAGDLPHRLPRSAPGRRSGHVAREGRTPPATTTPPPASSPATSRFSPAAISQQITIFGLGVMPYISASIIFQLLTPLLPSLEKLQKEGRDRPQEDPGMDALRDRAAVRSSRRFSGSARCAAWASIQSSMLNNALRDVLDHGSGHAHRRLRSF